MTGQARLIAAAALSVLPLGFGWSGGLARQAPIRVFLVLAALAFAVCAGNARTRFTRRLARVGCVSAAIGVALAAGHRSPQILLCLVGALVLVVPLVWARPTRFGNRRPAQVK